ncbi:MAG TPA: metallophosphoesterase [Spirochaetota bacterium]|nr:metallophosphoesterase [Spirochaetota bacterium]
MESEIKILFMSDIHLGMRNSEIHIPDYSRVNTFKRIAAIAREHDIFLIGGDLIDGGLVGSEILELVKSEFRALRNAKTEIIYTPGTGELDAGGSAHPFMPDFNASCIFSSVTNSTPYLYMKNGQKLYVYGVPATSGYDISKIRKISDEGYHIGLFHVDFDFDGDPSDVPVYRIQKNEIRALGLDFYAFGFNHNFRMFKILDRIIGVCAGSPESTSFDETGDRYVISIIVRENRLYQIKRLTVNSMKLYEDRIDCAGLVTMGPLKELLENNKSKKSIQRLVLEGPRDFVLRLDDLQKYRNEFFRMDIIDRSIPTIDALIEEFQYENTLRGEFFKLLKERIDGGGMPHEIDMKDLAVSLATVTRNGFNNLEEWLCNM